MTDTRQPQAMWRNQPNWLYLYLLLAVFVLVTLAIGGWINHRLILDHRHSVAVNREWVKLLITADEMARQASAIVQPVNNVLQSRDPSVEAAQFLAAHTLFDNTILAQIQELQVSREGGERQMLIRDCREVMAQMNAAVAVGNQIFEAVRTGATAQVAGRLAALNKEYDDLLAALNQLRAHYRQQRQAFLDAQLADAADLSRWEDFMVALALITLIGFAFYGMHLSRQIRASEAAVQAKNQEVAESRAFVRATMDSLQAHVCVVAEDGTLLAVNQAWLDFAAANPPSNGNIGVGADYLAVCDAATGADAEIAHAFATGIRAVMAGTLDRFEIEYPCHSPQQHRWFVGKVTRLIGGGTRRVVVAHENITARKEAEEAVRQSEEKYRVLVETTNTGFLILNHEGKVIDANEEYVRLTGHSELGDIVGKSVVDWTADHDQQRNAEAVAQCVKVGFVRNVVIDYVDGSGRFTPIEVNAAIIGEGESARIVSLCRDITERKQMETAVQAKNKELEQFTYSVSHDLRSPVVTIQTFLEYLKQDIPAQNAARVAADMSFIHTAVNKMAQLLDELLKLSRLGHQTAPAVDVLLQAVVKEALDLVAGRISQRGVQVTVPQDPVTLHGDRARFLVVFQNLVDNACKFMGDQKEPRIEIGIETRDAETVFFVRDNGVGIDPRHQAKVFGLFEKLDPKAEGVGIGLALVKRIVELQGGRIWVESPGLGKGTCFYFTLPGTEGRRKG